MWVEIDFVAAYFGLAGDDERGPESWKVQILSDDMPDDEWMEIFVRPQEWCNAPTPQMFTFSDCDVHFTCFEEELDGYLDWLRRYVDLANKSYARMESEPRLTQEARDAASAAHDAKKSARGKALRAKYPPRGTEHSPKAEARAKRERRANAEAKKRKRAR